MPRTTSTLRRSGIVNVATAKFTPTSSERKRIPSIMSTSTPIERVSEDWDFPSLYYPVLRVRSEWNIPDVGEGKLIYTMNTW